MSSSTQSRSCLGPQGMQEKCSLPWGQPTSFCRLHPLPPPPPPPRSVSHIVSAKAVRALNPTSLWSGPEGTAKYFCTVSGTCWELHAGRSDRIRLTSHSQGVTINQSTGFSNNAPKRQLTSAGSTVFSRMIQKVCLYLRPSEHHYEYQRFWSSARLSINSRVHSLNKCWGGGALLCSRP